MSTAFEMIRNKTRRRLKYIPSIPGEKENTFRYRADTGKNNSCLLPFKTEWRCVSSANLEEWNEYKIRF